MTINPDFAADLRKRIDGEVRLDLASRILYSTDASIYQIEPLGVALPRTRDDLQAIVDLAAKYHVPLIPRGAGTSLAGQAIGGGLVLDCSRWLNRIIEFDLERRIVRTEPGVVLSHLNRAAAETGLQFGPDPASADRATIGGIVANNATGAHSIEYGMTADHVVSANVVLADGSLANMGSVDEARLKASSGSISARYDAFLAAAARIRTDQGERIQQRFPRTWRNSAGYRLNYLLPWSPAAPAAWDAGGYPPASQESLFNSAHLLAGSEGTLAVIQDVTLRLVPRPAYTVLAILGFDELSAACDAVPGLLELQPSAIELIPRLILQLAKAAPGYASRTSWLRGDPAAMLVVEFSGNDPRQLVSRSQLLGSGAQVIESAVEQTMVWSTRKAGLGLLDSRPRAARPVSVIEDCAIPVDQLGIFVTEIQKVLAEHDAEGGIYGHASAGCLHIRPVIDLKSVEGVRALRQIAEQALALTLRLGGAMSSEHGDGIARGEWLEKTYGRELTDVMRALKRAADPEGLLNPGKMLDAPPMDTNLRYGPEYRSRAWSRALDSSRRGGLELAIEQCNGQGACRKDTGVMCPSFQATREEMHSTRGRANLLRALISAGSNPSLRSLMKGDRTAHSQPHLLDELETAVHNALDLCLACKGCSAECPSGVDMPRLKAAFLERRYANRARPLRDYIFGHFNTTARILALVGPLVGMGAKIPVLGRAALRAAGVTHKRPLPSFGASRPRPRAGGSASVLLVRDPFTHYLHPDVEDAAVRLMEAAAFRVRLIDVGGAGAALIAKGFLREARGQARRLLQELTAADPSGALPIVFLEPPELSAVKGEHRDLLGIAGDAEAERLERATSADELLVMSGKLPKAMRNTQRPRVLFQPHCHERAGFSSLRSSVESPLSGMQLLEDCGYDVQLVDAGCCGMAGTFGYEAEHYELSQKIGELQLFPAIRGDSDALIAATGGACRIQIEQGTGRRAEHPLVLAARALALL